MPDNSPAQSVNSGPYVWGAFDQATLDRLAAAELALANVPTVIFNGVVDSLPTPSAANVGRYARVTDLFGEKTDLVLCSAYGSNYFWQPVRPIWANTAVMSADVNRTITPLKSPSIIRLTGSMTGSRVVTLSTVGAWPGCVIEIQMVGTLSVYSLNIAGLALGATLSLILGGTKRAVYDGTAFQALG